MFVLEFFTVYPDSVSVRIEQKIAWQTEYWHYTLVATVSPLSRRIMMTSQIKIESQNFRCYNQPNIVSRQFSHNSTWTLLKDFRALFVSIYCGPRTTK